jgi:hypothetical protein
MKKPLQFQKCGVVSDADAKRVFLSTAFSGIIDRALHPAQNSKTI